ncbi:hypothetical protein BDF14DRAFT_585773 [Spinellus fusiger]|nr:hypothetical protein BDF14DRAFT_585773 [Spinellus fusiger]
MTPLPTKSILKKAPHTDAPPPSSWLSRIQSKLYATSDDTYGVMTLSKAHLRRVTFPVNRLTTHRTFHSNDMTTHDVVAEKTTREDVPDYYEQACCMREEPVLDRFLDVLRLNCFTQLTIIDLSNKPMDQQQAGPIADTLAVHPHLTQLVLSNCGLEDETVRLLLHSLLLCDSLSTLDLSNNPLKSNGFKYIAIYISQSRALQSLSLAKCTPDRMAMQYLSQSIQAAPSLQTLDLDECTLKPPLLELLSHGVRLSSSLLSLSLRNNRITAYGAPWIAAMVVTEEPIDVYWQSPEYAKRGLQTLDLAGNPLQQGVGALAQALYSNQSLVHLVLRECQINDEGCSLLAESLLSNQCLQTLDLSGNPLGKGSDEGIQSFKTTLARNPALVELNLANTSLGSSAAIALAEALPENSRLTRLDLSKNPSVTMAGVLALSVSVRMNTTLTFLDINIPDIELAQLQNDIVAVCTHNMQRAFEEKNKQDTHSTHLNAPGLLDRDINVMSSSSTSSSMSSTGSSLNSSLSLSQTTPLLGNVSLVYGNTE